MVLSMDRWVGKVAIVTGASAGIGASIVEQLVEAGVVVVGLARRKERVEELAKKLSGKKGKVHAVKADMANEEDILKAFKWVKENIGPVHILVNNAGFTKYGSLIEGDTKSWKAVFETNVIGLSIATREAIKDMKSNKIDGHIIHINAVLGHHVLNIPGINVYPASKYAVTALTETLRQELNSIGSKIKITSVSPGGVKTEFIQASRDVIPAEMAKRIAAMPRLNSEDVADAVTYVLSTPPHVQVHELTVQVVGGM